MLWNPMCGLHFNLYLVPGCSFLAWSIAATLPHFAPSPLHAWSRVGLPGPAHGPWHGVQYHAIMFHTLLTMNTMPYYTKPYMTHQTLPWSAIALGVLKPLHTIQNHSLVPWYVTSNHLKPTIFTVPYPSYSHSHRIFHHPSAPWATIGPCGTHGN